MNDLARAERTAAQLKTVATVWWWAFIGLSAVAVVLWVLAVADVLDTDPPAALTAAAVLMFLLTIDFGSAASTTQALLKLQKRIAALEERAAPSSRVASP